MFDFASIKNLIQKPKGRTAAEIRAAVTDVELALKGHETKAGELEERRKGVLLSGTDEEIETIDGQIKSANREVERGHAALAELNRLLGEAEVAETAAAIDDRYAAALETQGNMMRLYIELDAVAEKAARLLAEIDKGTLEIRAANAFLLENKRRDLKVLVPVGVLANHLDCNAGNLPQTANWTLHGYWPPHFRHPDNLRFDRMKELLAPGARRRLLTAPSTPPVAPAAQQKIAQGANE